MELMIANLHNTELEIWAKIFMSWALNYRYLGMECSVNLCVLWLQSKKCSPWKLPQVNLYPPKHGELVQIIWESRKHPEFFASSFRISSYVHNLAPAFVQKETLSDHSSLPLQPFPVMLLWLHTLGFPKLLSQLNSSQLFNETSTTELSWANGVIAALNIMNWTTTNLMNYAKY